MRLGIGRCAAAAGGPGRYNVLGIGRCAAAAGGMPADACVECGECEEKCPQNIPIREQLKEAHQALAPENNK